MENGGKQLGVEEIRPLIWDELKDVYPNLNKTALNGVQSSDLRNLHKSILCGVFKYKDGGKRNCSNPKNGDEWPDKDAVTKRGCKGNYDAKHAALKIIQSRGVIIHDVDSMCVSVSGQVVLALKKWLDEVD